MSESVSPIFVSHLTPRNFLSFGPANTGFELQALTVLIGANGSGKSNVIEAVSLMRSAARELREVTRRGGGVGEWIFKGAAQHPASVEWMVRYPKQELPLRHRISFRAVAQSFALDDERIEESEPRSAADSDVHFYYRYQNGQPVVSSADHGRRNLARENLDSDRSIIAQLRDPEFYPELAFLAQEYEKIRIYREWSFGRNAIFRVPQNTDSRNDALEEDFSNLGLFLNRLKTRFPAAKRAILQGLKDLYDGIQDFDVLVEGGTVQVYIHEDEFVIPAVRLSDGTLRYLCLLAILCDPEPPPLICIEEPELGLHPDILPKVADLLKSASLRTQLLVTTHSDILVDAMTETPEVVVVCSKEQGQTRLERLKSADLAIWLEEYRLGQLWTRGEIGGTRW